MIKNLEYLLMLLILVTIFWTFREREPVVKQSLEITPEEFEEYPLYVWKDFDERGNVCKIKNRVSDKNTKIWVLDVKTNEVIHQQPFDRDPNKDGDYRDFTYTWRLYKTERTIDVPPGTYEIIVGGLYKPFSSDGKLSVLVDI